MEHEHAYCLRVWRIIKAYITISSHAVKRSAWNDCLFTMDKFFDMTIKKIDHVDALIVQALGKDISFSSEEGHLEAYQYQGQIFIIDFKSK